MFPNITHTAINIIIFCTAIMLWTIKHMCKIVANAEKEEFFF